MTFKQLEKMRSRNLELEALPYPTWSEIAEEETLYCKMMAAAWELCGDSETVEDSFKRLFL